MWGSTVEAGPHTRSRDPPGSSPTAAHRLARTVVFYGLNAVTLGAPDDDAHDLVIAIASGTTTYHYAAEQLSHWH